MSRLSQQGRWPILATMIPVIFALASIPAAAQEAPLCPEDHNGRVADVFYGSTKIVFEPIVEHERLNLSVRTPCGDVVKSFDRGETPIFDLVDVPGQVDGAYSWELRVEPVVHPAVRARLDEARASGDLEMPLILQSQGLLPTGPLVDSAGFRVTNGKIVDPDSGQNEGQQASGGARAIGEMTPGSAGLMTPLPAQVVLTNSNGVIRNSLCVGFDCPDSPSFGDSTTLFMENNTRLKFDDTSTISGFPRNDWELKANDTNSGGRSYLAFADCGLSSQGDCADDEVFVVEAGVRENALYVESDGDIGIGTQNPVLRIHAVDGDSPGLRLEQDGSSGFAPQTWDIAGNETNFFVRDVTGGSTLPFRIRPGAPSSSIDIAADGDVGIGTSSPSSTGNVALHVKRTNSTEIAALLQTNGVTTRFRLQNDNDATGGTWSVGARQNTNFIITRDGTGLDEFSIDTSGNVTIPAGAMYLGSDRDLKHEVVAIDPQEFLDRVATLPLSTWSWKRDAPSLRHVGPMAQDFYAAFGLGRDEKTIAPMDLASVSLAAIQGLNHLLEQKADLLEQKADRLEAENDALRDRLAAIEATLAALTGSQAAPADSAAP